jgi:hypothetical protein
MTARSPKTVAFELAGLLGAGAAPATAAEKLTV